MYGDPQTTTAPTTSTTTAKPSTPASCYTSRIKDEVTKKLKEIGSWCTNCYEKAKRILKDFVGWDDDDVYRDDDNVSTLLKS